MVVWLNMAGGVVLAGRVVWLRFLTRNGLPPDELAGAKPPSLTEAVIVEPMMA